MAICTRPGPGPRAIDVAVIGPDGNVYGSWAVDPEHVKDALYENLGSPFGAKSCSLAWTLDGHQLLITCHSTTNQMFTKVFDTTFGWLDGGGWQPSTAHLAA